MEVSKAVSRIADVLPRTELHSLLYSTPRMQENVAQLYAKILDFSIKAIQFYKKGKLSHSIASIVKPFSLTFKPIIEEIRERSIRVDELASALSKAEIRDLHVKVHRLSQSVAQLTEMMVCELQHKQPKLIIFPRLLILAQCKTSQSYLFKRNTSKCFKTRK